MNSFFKHAVIGGTFDHFHIGHKKLIDETISKSETITIGVSTEKLYSGKTLASRIESFQIRQSSVYEYIKSKKTEKLVKFIPIDDIFGTTLQERNIDAIFVTEENKYAADEINKERQKINFPMLSITVVPFVNGNDGKVISSERIRKGEIDRNGFSYSSLFKKSLELPSELRATLREPIGDVTTDINEILAKTGDDSLLIAVGDIVTLSFIEAGYQAVISVFDFKTRRHEINNEQKALLKHLSKSAVVCVNAAGKIEAEAVSALENAIKENFKSPHKQTIMVKGEEDLLTLPVILLAPLGSHVVYGLFDKGAVDVEVTEDKKSEIKSLVKQFISLS